MEYRLFRLKADNHIDGVQEISAESDGDAITIARGISYDYSELWRADRRIAQISNVAASPNVKYRRFPG